MSGGKVDFFSLLGRKARVGRRGTGKLPWRMCTVGGRAVDAGDSRRAGRFCEPVFQVWLWWAGVMGGLVHWRLANGAAEQQTALGPSSE